MVDPAEKRRLSPVASESAGPAAVETAAFASILQASLTDPLPSTCAPGHSADDLSEAPQRIGRYRVLRRLGRGAFGSVWLAADDELRRQVAIKLVPSDRLTGDDADAYLHEGRALAALDHPHIVPVFDVGRAPDRSVFVVSKFIEGTTLFQELHRRQLSCLEAVAIVRTLAQAVSHAHERNLIHRDIKPANILIETATGRIYLADFGLAQRPNSSGAAVISGTPAYMSPEQASGAPTDARSDLFSLGVVLYELLTGQRPFQAKSIEALLDLVTSGPFSPVQDIAPQVPAELARICDKLLQKDPTARHHTARELAEDLERWEAQQRRLADVETFPTNLPTRRPTLVGREQEIAHVSQLVQQSQLVTLTGIGGVGKTSLAVEAASGSVAAFPDGVFLADLTPLTDASLIPAAIAQAMDRRLAGQGPADDELAQAIGERHVLLVLDNCEHLAAAGHVAPLLRACPALHILATSRAPLRITGELEFPVSLLTLPDQTLPQRTEELERCSALRLFVQRARELMPDFALTDQNRSAVVDICVRLDGLPLAIELAAARINVLAPQALSHRLEKSLQILTARRTDVPQRQRTLQQAIAWSYELLSPGEQQLFRRLAVFSGGFTLEAAERIAADGMEVLEGVTALVENSLVRRSAQSADARFQMLTAVREFALEKLKASHEADSIAQRHALWVLDLVESAEPQLVDAEAARWTRQLTQEHFNVRAALAWCLQTPLDTTRGETGQRIAGALWRFWCCSGQLREARDWLSRLLTAFGTPHDAVGAKLRYAAGCIEEDLADYPAARRHYQEAIQLWNAVDDKAHLADGYIALGSISSSQGDYAAAREFFQQALETARQLNDRRMISVALSNLGSLAWSGGDYELARKFHSEALAIRRELGNRSGVAVSLTSLGLIASREGDLQGAAILYEESLVILRELDNQVGIAVSLNNLGEIAYRQGDVERAETMLWEAVRIQHRAGDRLSMAYTLESIAAAAQQQGSYEAALRFFAAAEGLRQALGAPLPPVEKASNDKLVQEVRLALGPERFVALWTAALATPLDRIVAEGMPKT